MQEIANELLVSKSPFIEGECIHDWSIEFETFQGRNLALEDNDPMVVVKCLKNVTSGDAEFWAECNQLLLVLGYKLSPS
ncbi:hypothetical protein JHK85_010497 [Glycine max]|nr:hypothetical protein JHK85_010497 [Glycine max]